MWIALGQGPDTVQAGVMNSDDRKEGGGRWWKCVRQVSPRQRRG